MAQEQDARMFPDVYLIINQRKRQVIYIERGKELKLETNRWVPERVTGKILQAKQGITSTSAGLISCSRFSRRRPHFLIIVCGDPSRISSCVLEQLFQSQLRRASFHLVITSSTINGFTIHFFMTRFILIHFFSNYFWLTNGSSERDGRREKGKENV